MKTLLTAVVAASLMLGACASQKTEAQPQAQNLSLEEAVSQCKQSLGENTQDQTALDACMKDKGFERPAAAAPAAQ